MKRITGIIMGLAVAITATAGPGRITVTNEAGVVFRDVEVLSDNAGVLSIRTTNGVEFVKVHGHKKPTMVVTNAPATNTPPKASKLFKFNAGRVDDFDGQKFPDYWEAESRKGDRLVTLLLRPSIGQSYDVSILHFTRTKEQSSTARLRIDGKVIDFPNPPWFERKTVKKDGVFIELERINFNVPRELFEFIKQAGAIRLRIIGNDKLFEFDFPGEEKP